MEKNEICSKDLFLSFPSCLPGAINGVLPVNKSFCPYCWYEAKKENIAALPSLRKTCIMTTTGQVAALTDPQAGGILLKPSMEDTQT